LGEPGICQSEELPIGMVSNHIDPEERVTVELPCGLRLPMMVLWVEKDRAGLGRTSRWGPMFAANALNSPAQ
jgi:hypothetical protein